MNNYFQTLSTDVQAFINSLDFSNALPKRDGKVLKSNYDIYSCLLDVLHAVGYSSPTYEPLPPILYNYRDIERKCLVKFGRKIIEQIKDGLDIRLCIIDIDGFRFFFRHPKTCDFLNGGRVYTLDFEYEVVGSHRHQRSFVPEVNLSAAIDKYFSRSELDNKVLLIK